MSKPSLPQGTRDFNAIQIRKRQYIFNTIKTVFELYGFQPLETPAMENLDTLMGKYGDEGDKLIFKILNNGLDNPAKHEQLKNDFDKVLEGKTNKGITERALRYDLTIPFARYVASNYGEMVFPFRRYQLQPVWRADRPQRGRYREFYQCDADVVGSNSLLIEVELANIYADVFSRLGIEVAIKMNNRKILLALAELCGAGDKMMAITTVIDKLDKIGIEKVREELLNNVGLDAKQIELVMQFLGITGKNHDKLFEVKKLMSGNRVAGEGIGEMETILNYLSNSNGAKVEVDFTLARGLNYYTGAIFEVTAHHVQMGSIGGGGRYNDLTSLFDLDNMPGVGISFGVDRIYDVMDELKLFPIDVHSGTQVLFFNMGMNESLVASNLMKELRNRNVSCELYHEQTKFDKQFKYAERKGITYVVVMGSEEIANNTCLLKNIKTSVQTKLEQRELLLYNFK